MGDQVPERNDDRRNDAVPPVVVPQWISGWDNADHRDGHCPIRAIARPGVIFSDRQGQAGSDVPCHRLGRRERDQSQGGESRLPLSRNTRHCGGVRVRGNPSPGTVFPIGTTRVTATASDPSGNTAKLSFDVVVKGAHEQFVAVRRGAESVAGNRARPKADAAAIERLLRDPRDKVQSRACDPLGNLQRALAPPAGNPTARRAEVITSLTRIRHVLSC